MFSYNFIIYTILIYLLFFLIIAYWADKKLSQNHILINNPLTYTLIFAVYCTSWTFYGSIGSATTNGLLFLGVYLGPVITIPLWCIILRKIIRIRNLFKTTDIVDFITSRYEKSQLLGLILAIFILIGILPYMAVQIQAIFTSIHLLHGGDILPNQILGLTFCPGEIFILVTIIIITILFGIRRLQSSRQHTGLMFAIALQSILKLTAFLTAGIFITYFVFHSPFDLIKNLNEFEKPATFLGATNNLETFLLFFVHIVLSAFAMIFLPRQFHVAIIENVNTNHIKFIRWMFPIYLLLINLFVLPIAAAGLMLNLDLASADYFILIIPYLENNPIILLITFLGGFAASLSMIIISTLTITNIVSNNLIIPFINKFNSLKKLNHYILQARWATATFLIFISYMFFKFSTDHTSLTTTGMISFIATFQFAPMIFGALFWKRASKTGAIIGVTLGFIVWFYTLVLPLIIQTGWWNTQMMEMGPFGLSFLRPENLFFLDNVNKIIHSFFWTALFNGSGFFIGTLLFPQSIKEIRIAEDFFSVTEIDNYKYSLDLPNDILLKPKIKIIKNIFLDYFSLNQTEDFITEISDDLKLNDIESIDLLRLSKLKNGVERFMAGHIGTSSANEKLKISKLITDLEQIKLNDYYQNLLLNINISPEELIQKVNMTKEKQALAERSADIFRDRVLQRTEQLEEQKVKTLLASRLSALGELSAGIGHEINNPLTVISGNTKIIKKVINAPELDQGKCNKAIIGIEESIARMSKIIISMRNLSRDTTNEQASNTKILEIVEDAISMARDKFKSQGIILEIDTTKIDPNMTVWCKRISFSQVFINLLNNAYDAILDIIDQSYDQHWIKTLIYLNESKGNIIFEISDSGPGIPEEIKNKIFEPFFTTKEVGKGTGLGLSLANKIIEDQNGLFYLDESKENTTFVIELPNKQS